MQKYILILLFCPALAFGQRSGISLNLPSLLVNSLEVEYDKPLSKGMALALGAGLRFQNSEFKGTNAMAYIGDYIDLGNRAAGLSVGLRFADRTAYEYPYISLHAAGGYYQDRYFTALSPTGQVLADTTVTGVAFGGCLRLGMVIKIYNRISIDAGGQFTIAPYRRDLKDSYYFPQMGFTTYGTVDLLSGRGIMIQPTLRIRYEFGVDKREEIYEKE